MGLGLLILDHGLLVVSLVVPVVIHNIQIEETMGSTLEILNYILYL